MSDFVETLKQEFHDPEYRHAYSTQFVDAKIGTQIKVLREQRGWSQEALAEKAGMKQSRISALESVNYSAWSVNTLRRLAKALDVALDVEFKTFGQQIREMEGFSRESLQAVSFDNDPQVRQNAVGARGVVVNLMEGLRLETTADSTGDVAPRRNFVTTVNSMSATNVNRIVSSIGSTGEYLDRPRRGETAPPIYRQRIAVGGKR